MVAAASARRVALARLAPPGVRPAVPVPALPWAPPLVPAPARALLPVERLVQEWADLAVLAQAAPVPSVLAAARAPAPAAGGPQPQWPGFHPER